MPGYILYTWPGQLYTAGYQGLTQGPGYYLTQSRALHVAKGPWTRVDHVDRVVGDVDWGPQLHQGRQPSLIVVFQIEQSQMIPNTFGLMSKLEDNTTTPVRKRPTGKSETLPG